MLGSESTDVDPVVVTGQRRPAGSSMPFPAISLPDPLPQGDETIEPSDEIAPCDDPEKRRDINADGAAAKTVKDLKQFSLDNPAIGLRGFSAREYGAVLWELPDGSVVHGPMTWGEFTFQEAAQTEEGRSGVALDWTVPMPGAVPIGTVHTHPTGGHVPSGRPGMPNGDDYGTLTSTQQWREYYSQSTNGYQARIYVAADNLVNVGEEQVTQVNVYDHRNIEKAVAGYYVGPEVNPEAEQCGLE